MIEKITRHNFVMDESGYTDHELIVKVNEIIDYLNDRELVYQKNNNVDTQED